MSRLAYFGKVAIYLYGFTVFGLMCLLFAPIALPIALLPTFIRAPLRPLIRVATHAGYAFVCWHCRMTGFATMRFFDHRNGPKSPLWIANHLSMFDIVLLFGFIRGIQTLVNSKFTRNPLLWPIIRAAGYIPVQVHKPESGVEAFETLGHSLKEGQTVVLFPEGTRSADGQLGPLKRGAFRLARDQGIKPDFVFFTCNQPFLNRAAFFPKQPGPVVLEAHLFTAPDSPDRAWQRVFEDEYQKFRHSAYALEWNRLKEKA